MSEPIPDGALPPRLTYMVKQLELAVRSEMEDIVGVFGVTALQYTALSVLARHPGMSSAELARRSFVSAQAGSEMIGLLERKGLISRTPHEANRRILRITLTPEGYRLLAECDERIDELESRMLAPLSAAKSQQLRQALAACTRSLRARSAKPAELTAIPSSPPKPSVKPSGSARFATSNGKTRVSSRGATTKPVDAGNGQSRPASKRAGIAAKRRQNG